MNLSNMKFMQIYRIVLIVLSLLLVITIVFLNLFFEIIGLSAFGLILLALIIFTHITIRQIFEYNSEGEVLIIRNKNIFTGNNRYRGLDEFPKILVRQYKLQKTFLKKKLYISIKGRSRVIILNYDVTFVKTQKLKELEDDLKKLIGYEAA
ncbi:hypothetical protein [Chryseobacterium aurantiacum]|uniref:hypothetical protein n=1 Tax=Chryseobacterium aurantiacum TaxID=2116499 RepID=UPI0013C3E5B0|nr:hypothetical protein [Chryseobacterium aurantiacum]